MADAIVTSADALVTLIEERILAFYQAFKDGKDVSPAFLYRTEGMMDAALLQELISEQALQTLKRDCYRRCFDEALSEENLGEPQELLTLMKRAPVYPSTKPSTRPSK